MKQISEQAINQAVSSRQSSASRNESEKNMEDSQAADWVWLKMTEIYGGQWNRENGEEPSSTWILALNKLQPDQVKKGIAETVRSGITWPPNLPKFIELCEGGSDETDSFDRFIDKKSPADYAETLTRQKVGYRCRAQLPEDKARKLWTATISKFRAKIASGEITLPDPSAKRVDTPEKMKERLTPEQRNQQLDRQIDEMLANGTPLIGPFKTRYEERQNES